MLGGRENFHDLLLLQQQQGNYIPLINSTLIPPPFFFHFPLLFSPKNNIEKIGILEKLEILDFWIQILVL